MTGRIAFVALLACACARPSSGQTGAIEVVQSAGVSNELIAGAGVQLRGLFQPTGRFRVYLEAAWGDRSGTGSDVFGTAYPYGGRVDAVENYGELTVQTKGLRFPKAGRYRTPFGLANASDHAYVGFLRPPLIRYGGYFALSSGYLEEGADFVAGAPHLSAEFSLGRSADVGTARRRPGALNKVGRIEGSLGPIIVGASVLRTMPDQPAYFAFGRATFRGVDARWMQAGVQIRGEWIDGVPFEGTTTKGGYLDAIVHTRVMGPVTALARAEKLDYDTPVAAYRLFTHRYVAATRIRIWRGLSTSFGVSHQGGRLTQHRPTAFDTGVSWALRKDFASGQ